MAENIIIDGCDVKDCKRRIGKDNYCRYYKRPCAENNYNCIWKKYYRKEQENKDLREDIKDIAILLDLDTDEEYNFGNIELEIKELKAENERQKEFRKLLEEQMEFNKSELELSLSSEIKRSDFLLKEFKKVDKQRDNWREQAEKLKQTLAEIKEIAEGRTNYPCSYCINKEILQKISECEVEDG